MKRIHRLVILPDYQGLGLGTAFLTAVTEIYKNENFRIRLVTSHPALIHGLKKPWVLKHFGRKTTTTTGIKGMNATISKKRKTASFEFSP